MAIKPKISKLLLYRKEKLFLLLWSCIYVVSIGKLKTLFMLSKSVYMAQFWCKSDMAVPENRIHREPIPVTLKALRSLHKISLHILLDLGFFINTCNFAKIDVFFRKKKNKFTYRLRKWKWTRRAKTLAW